MADFEQATCQHLRELFQQLSSASPPQNVLDEIRTIPTNPNLIFPLLANLETETDVILSNRFALQISNFMRKIDYYTKRGQSDEIFGKVFSILPILNNDLSRNCLIDRLGECSMETPAIIEHLVALSLQFFENPQLIKAAFHIWNTIIIRAYEANTDFIYSRLIPAAIAALRSTDKNTRIEAYSFMGESLVVCAQNDEENAFFNPETFGSLVTEIQTTFTHIIQVLKDESELFIFSKNVEQILKYMPMDYIENYFVNPLFEQFTVFLSADELSSQFKRHILLPLDIIMIQFAGTVVQQIPACIPGIINLTVVLAKENPEEGLYKNTETFFEHAAIAFEEGGITNDDGEIVTAMSFFMPIIQELIETEDPAALLVIFLIFNSVVSSNPAEIMDIYEDIETNIVIASFESEDSDLIDAALTFLENLAIEAQSMALHLQTTFEPILIEFISSNEENPITNKAIQVLSTIYDASESSPEDISHSIEFLLSLFESAETYRHELAFNAIINLLKYSSDVPEGLYDALKPIITELISSGEGAVGPAILGFSAFALVDPRAIEEDLPQMIEVIKTTLQNHDVPELVDFSLQALLNLIEPFIETLSPMIPELYQISLAVFEAFFSNEEDDFGEEEEEFMADDVLSLEQANEEADREGEIYRNRTNIASKAFLLCCLLLRFANEELSSSEAAKICEYLIRLMDKDSGDSVSEASRCLTDIVIGTSAVNFDIRPTIREYLANYNTISYSKAISDFWEGLSYGYRSLPHDAAIELTPDIMDIVLSLLNGESSVYNRNNQNGNLPKTEIEQQLLVMIEEIIIQTGEEFAAFLEKTFNVLLRCLEDTNKVSKGHAIRTLSFLSSFFPQHPELAQKAFEQVATLAEETFPEVRSTMFLSYHFITLANKEIVQEIAPQLLQMAMEAMKESESSYQLSDNASILWCTLVQTFQVVPSQADFDLLFSIFPTSAHNYMLRANSIFLHYALNTWPEIITPHALSTAVTVLGSDDVTQTFIPREIAIVLAQIVSTAGEGEPEEIAHYNQLQIHYLKKHIAELTASS